MRSARQNSLRTMKAKSSVSGSSISPFIFHSTCISHGAKSFAMCGENYCKSVDTEESKSTCEETWKFCFRLHEVNHKIWFLDSFHDHRTITLFRKYFLKILIFYCFLLQPSRLGEWDTGKAKEYFASVQVLFWIPVEQLELVKTPFCTRTCSPGETTSGSLFSFKLLSFSPGQTLRHFSPHCITQIQQQDYSSFISLFNINGRNSGNKPSVTVQCKKALSFQSDTKALLGDCT